MNIYNFIDSKLALFTKTDHKIYEYIKQSPDNFSKDSISEISNSYNLSKSALTRFSQKLGFSGYNEFQFFLKQNEPSSNKEDEESLAKSISNLLLHTEEIISDNTLESFINKLRHARITYILGYSVTRLASDGLGMILNFLAKILASNPNLDNLPEHHTSEDVVIIYSSLSGEVYKNYISNLSESTSHRPYLILITTNPKHPLRHHFNEVILLPSFNIARADSVTHELFTYLFFNELVAQKLLKE